ncbi:MAG: hypothetical protein JST86_20075 [Bacteroidetes bacterium]|nr:hypothetical protein [Bacteroidota bacterium]
MQENYREFQVGNWVVYRPEGNYCTIKYLSPVLILEGALQTYTCTVEQIGKIQITVDKLQVCGFDIQYPKFIKKFNHKICVVLVFSTSGFYRLFKNDEEFCVVQFIHQVQNAYYEITGEFLRGNLFGVREG